VLTAALRASARPDRRYHALTVKRITRETADAVSLAFDVPSQLRDRYRYEAGQFLTLRLRVDGAKHLRCYSMSSAPDEDADLQVTVKRVPGGVVSNWLNDGVVEGDEIEASVPSGDFVLRDSGRDLVAFAGGSGITPVFSLAKAALASTDRKVRVFYANRTQDSIIFRDAVDLLMERSGGRLDVRHHVDDLHGVVDDDEIAEFLGADVSAEFYVCGPAPFMDAVDQALREREVPAAHVHVERFTPPDASEDDEIGGAALHAEVTAVCGAKKVIARRRGSSTLLQTARAAGLRVPSACEVGECASCMARVVVGAAVMRRNTALTPEEVAEGWVLTCTAEPTSPFVTVVYD
jgi:3-ketosteroid 9alpha-monooxygenase subunit B